MKKLLYVLALVGMVTTAPALANDDKRYSHQTENRYERYDGRYKHDRHDNHRRYEKHDRNDHRHRHSNNGRIVFSAIIGSILGSHYASRDYRDYRDYSYYNRSVYPERRCFEYLVVDPYGRVVSRFDCR